MDNTKLLIFCLALNLSAKQLPLVNGDSPQLTLADTYSFPLGKLEY